MGNVENRLVRVSHPLVFTTVVVVHSTNMENAWDTFYVKVICHHTFKT